MKKIAIIAAVIDDPSHKQVTFNNILSDYKHIIVGRMGLPFDQHDISVIAITVLATVDDINTLTGRLGALNGVTVKTAITRKELST